MDAMTLPDDVKEQLERFEAALGSVERGLEPLLAADRRELEAHLTPLERAKVHITLANAVSTLFCSASPTLDPATATARWSPSPVPHPPPREIPRAPGRPLTPRFSSPLSFAVYLKAVGLDPAEHAVRRELERVDLYRAKVDKSASGERRAARVDAAAAARFVEHALGNPKRSEGDARGATKEGEDGGKKRKSAEGSAKSAKKGKKRR